MIKISETRYFYFYGSISEDHTFTYWGQQEVERPETNRKGFYIVPNKDSRVSSSQIKDVLDYIESTYSEVTEGKVRRTIVRNFPGERARYIIFYRLITSKVRYVLMRNTDGTLSFIERKVMRSNLPEITRKIREVTEIKEKIERQI